MQRRYADAIQWLYAQTDYEMTPLRSASAERLELGPLRALLARLGDPQRGRHSIHITGSKGKGSTAAMIEALLRGAGERTGLFTSPHLHSERERIRIDGAPIEEERFVNLVEQLRPTAEALIGAGQKLTTFDLRTALAFLAFRELGVTWQVIEVGLGGRLDSTNVLDDKELCVFTPVSLEHTQVLGSTVAAIATDKSGILRPGTRAVMAVQRESAADVFRERCKDLGVPLAEIASDCALAVDRPGADDQSVRLQTPVGKYAFKLPLLGKHQAENAATAIRAVELLADAGVKLAPETVSTALGAVRWPGRLEVLKRRPFLVVDGAHNIDSARRLAQAITTHLSPRRTTLVVGLNADKDIQGFAEVLSGALRDLDVVATRAAIGRAAPPEQVVRAFDACDVSVRGVPSVAEAVDSALGSAGPGDLVCVTGSLYVVAEARAWVLGILGDGQIPPSWPHPLKEST